MPLTPRMRRALTSAVLAIAVAAPLTACGTADTSSTQTSHRTVQTTDDTVSDDTADVTSDTNGLDQHELTRLSINITWDGSTPTDQQNMCNGITLFGTDWAATELRKGAGDDSLDWDYAALLIQHKCGL
ncbi:hypothetical protein [Streptomyces lydicus]|uniref:hypothetical protein n=1 Tax=Streptomyces lydicus TaxID=47763 RepID=UPI0037BB0EE1